jgi:polysaccharide chain length determinant protein (PEP-CTERM system associated)
MRRVGIRMIGQRELTIEDYKSILQRRIWLLIIPAVVFSASAYAISLYLPARYTSETVVLVEAPAVSADLVRPIGGDTNQRLATMREEILSRTRLQQIIEKFNLYREDLGKRPMEELVARLRSSIDVSAVRPMDRTNASGLPGFTIDVTAGRPPLAQQICTEITSMFLQQNVIVTERKANDTTDFISRQLQEAKAKLDDQDAKLADFQRHYVGALPDEAPTNFSLLTGLASQLDSVTQSLNRAQQDKLFLESALSQQIATAKLSQTAGNPDTLSRQLTALQDQLASLRIHYTDDHPDVSKVKSEIAHLQQRMNEQAAKAHPADETGDLGSTVDTPQAQQLRAQLHQIDVNIRERMAEQSRLQQQISGVQAKLELIPAVAQQYKALTRDYQTALNIYNDLLRKQSDSEMSRDLLRRQQGEQFRVLDAPSLPQKPTFPNRRLFAFGGLAGGLGFGLAIAFLLEAQDTSLRTDKDVEHLLKLPTLAVIPAIKPASLNGGTGSAKIAPVREDKPINVSVGV